MNKVREKIMNDIKPYMNFAEHKDLIAFTVGADYFTYDCETDEELEADFEEFVAVVEKDWLFNYMRMNGVENPLDYLKNEYIWDDSYEWFNNAKALGKLVVVSFD